MKVYVSKPVGIAAALIFSFSILVSTGSFAQGPGLPGGPDYDPDREVPIDGGVAILVAAGLAYGVKKIRARPLS